MITDGTEKVNRNANVVNKKNGTIYNLMFDIAKSEDGRTILYATDGKIERVGHAEVNSLKIKGSGQESDSTDTLSQKNGAVNTDSKNNYQLTEQDTEYLTLAKNPEKNEVRRRRGDSTRLCLVEFAARIIRLCSASRGGSSSLSTDFLTVINIP